MKLFILITSFALSISANSKINKNETKLETFKNSILDIKITSQSPNFIFPWQSKKPQTLDAIGIVVEENKILVLTSILEHHTSIEVKKQNGQILPAKIIKRDTESNLSLLEIEDKSFFSDLKAIQFENEFSPQGNLSVFELGDSGNIQIAKAYNTGIDQETYPISYTRLPYIKISSSEKMDGNGELLVEKNKAIGLLYRFTQNKNSGKAIPGFIINQFLNSKSKSSPFPFKGFKFKQVSDKATKEFYGLKESEEGVQVTEIFENSTSSGKIELNDIILEVGNQKIDSEGYFTHPKFGKQLFSLIIHSENHFGYKIGSLVPIKLIRNKKEIKLNLILKPFPFSSVKIPYANLQEEPKYLISGGFIFAEMSEFLLKEFGNSWRGRVDKKLLYLNDYQRYEKKKEKGKYILLIQVMPDISNNGYHNLSFDLVNTVDGKKIGSLEELNKAIENKKNKFLDIELDNAVNIILDKEKLPEINSRISQKFGLSELKNF